MGGTDRIEEGKEVLRRVFVLAVLGLLGVLSCADFDWKGVKAKCPCVKGYECVDGVCVKEDAVVRDVVEWREGM